MDPSDKSGHSTDQPFTDVSAAPAKLTEVPIDAEPKLVAEELGPQAVMPRQRRLSSWRRPLSLMVLGVGLVLGILLALHALSINKHQATLHANQADKSLNLKSQTIPLSTLGLSSINPLAMESGALIVNGQLNVANSIALTPMAAPVGAVAGQLYYDQQRNQLSYYNGGNFVYLQGGSGAVTNNITNVTSNVTNVTNTSNGTTGITAINGTAGSIAMFDGAGALTESMITQTGSTLSTGTGVENVTVGSTTGASTTIVQGGLGNVSINTGAVSGTSGTITIESGASSTTAAGDVVLDTGESIINGTLIADKTFEDGTTDNMGDAIFGDNSGITVSTAEAHSGTHSLAVSVGSFFYPSWAVGDGVGNPPYKIPVVAGHTYALQAWVRAGTNADTITASVIWSNDGYAGGGLVSQQTFGTVTDNASGWQKVAGILTAPVGAYSMGFGFSSSDASAVGEVHYFDDITITDLTTSPSEAAVNIGTTNAQVITIGNSGMLAPTTIYGSGINLAAGAGFINGTSSYLSLSGTTGGNIATSTGALTLTSGTTASWGIGGSSFAGGNLTLHAGAAGGNNNGGNLILAAGAGAGTGSSGSVIVKPPTDSTAAFQIQNSSGSSIFNVDTTTSTVQLNNSHTVLAGIAAPTSAPTATATGSGILNGTYYYQVTYVTASGETNAGPTVSVATASQQVDLANIPTGPAGVIARKIYRTVANPSWPYPTYYLATISDNSTTSYVDNATDGSLGGGAPNLNTTSYISNTEGESSSEAFGQNATVNSSAATAVGYNAFANWAAVAVGSGASASNSGGIAIGQNASVDYSGVTIGYNASSWDHSVAIGSGATTSGNDSIALGESAHTTSTNQFVVGSSSGAYVQDAYIGSGVTDTTPHSVTLHATGGSGTDIAGASVTLAGGIGTGLGSGGDIAFQIAAPGVTSGSTPNTLATVATISGVDGSALFKNAANSTTAFQIQSSGGATILAADTANSIITVTNLVATGTLTVDGHIITGGSTPGIVAGAAACTGPTVSMSGNDTSGTVTVTTGTSCTTSGTLATVTFANAFAAAPHVLVTPGGAGAAGLNAYVDDSTVSTTSFVLGTGSTPTASTTYKWNYLVVQ